MAERNGTIPSFQEFQQLMNDPGIDSNTKRGLALRYFDYVEDEEEEGDAQSYGFQGDEDRNHWRDYYKDKLSISEGDMDWETSSAGDVDKWYGMAKGQADKSAQGQQQKQQQAVDGDRQKLKDQAAKGSDTDPGVANSNEIFDLGASGLQPFRNLLPLYNRARATVAQNLPEHPFQQDVGDPFDEQRDIPFSKFKTAAQGFTDVNGSMVDAAADQDNRMATVFANWGGDAKDSAQDSWGTVKKGTQTVEQTLTGAADAVNRATASIAKLCRSKCQWLQDYYITEYPNKGDLSPQDIDRLIRVAEMGRNASDDDFKHFLRFMPSDLQGTINDDCADLGDDTKDAGQAWAKKWLADFCGFMDKHVSNWHLVCENTRTGVDQVWNGLGATLNNAREDLFTSVGPGGDQGGGTHTTGGTPGGASSSAGPGASGGTSAAAAPAAGAAPKLPEMPPASPAPQTGVPGLNPVTHQPLEVDPATGRPYPIDPGTGAVIKDAAEPEEVTVEQGDHRISMSEPGADGRMGITVDDGSGKAKDYRLDFGDGRPTSADGQPGHGGAPAAQDAGPAHQPGPDGKIHIDDGKLKIVAERPEGASGPTVVTVDDGSGQPTKYTLGEDGDPKPGAPVSPGGAAAPVSSGGGAAIPAGQTDAGAHPASQVQHHVGQEQPVASGVPAAAQHGIPAASVHTGPDDSTTAQSLVDPTDSRSGFDGHHADSGLGETGSSTGVAGGGYGQGSTSELGTAPGTPDQQGSASGGMGMMGGMMGGAGNTGAGGGEDQQRASSAYRVEAGLFGSSSSGGRISGSLDDDEVIGR
ncbi:WXG100 family type VII secretion target [Amycolatopsis saalfeldensis]|uniref:Proteins of 100 residues with WXG n=1 Tax=Amycolatopsis saalfeldensis TaxID=394193 RepID=A0A1H8YHK2_9PSEU|nr:WXG100 family type VII secretion target [Amycolatopsis saalfeldensis]SEP51694.1 Proteins of 100 residues with WXG [Amycolatopsis saalfeldensis]